MLLNGAFEGFDHDQRFGFYTTRWIEAASDGEAASRALAIVAEELKAQHVAYAQTEKAILVDECVEVSRQSWDKRTGGGFTWFPEEKGN